MRRFVFVLVVVALLAGLVLPVAAQGQILAGLPPGIAMQAEPLLEAMMQHMQEMSMSPEQMAMMMADMQEMADTLPAGIFLRILQLMPQLSMQEMMAFHQAVQQEGLLQQPPGTVLVFVLELAQ
jgi:hypothetical protein